MKILLVANYLPDQQESMRRFAELHEAELNARGHDVRLIRPQPRVTRWRPGSQGLGKWLGYVDKFVLFPNELKRAAAWADVVHVVDHSNAMYLPAIARHAHLITCHDMIAVRAARGEFPQHQVRFSGRRLQAWILGGLAHARYVVCVSEASRHDLVRLVPHLAERTAVVPNGMNYPYGPLSAEEVRPWLESVGLNPERPYFLHVGGDAWYKNRTGAVEIFARAIAREPFRHHQLVLAGSPPSGPLRDRVFSDPELAERVHIVPKPSNPQLHALYVRASALIFPSHAEGFGWPIIEAQACGCPVLTSNRAPMSEVAGGAAILVDPDDPEAAADELVRQVASFPALSAAGIKNAARFDNQTVLDAYERIYRSLRS